MAKNENQESGEKPEKTLMQLIKEDPKRLGAIREAAQEVIQCDKESQALNARRSAARSKVRKLGVNGNAFNAAVSRLKLTETDREEREESYLICLHALGVEHNVNLLQELHPPEE